MKKCLPVLISTFLCISHFDAFSQAAAAQFSINATGCINENLVLQNLSTNASAFTWDFCFKDLEVVKQTSNVLTVAGATTPTGISFFKDNGQWFGFVSSRDDNRLIRLDFGSSLENTPTIVNLGNPSNLLQGPQGLVFIREGGIVYAILTNFGGSNLLRLSFTSGLNAIPVVENLGNLGLVSPRGIDLDKDQGGNIIVSVADDIGQKISLINFGNSITNNPTTGDIINISLSSGGRPIGVQLFNNGTDWFAFTSLYSANTITKLEFGSSLSSSPTLTNIYSLTNPTELSFNQEGSTSQLFVATASGSIHRITNPELSSSQMATANLGNFNLLNNIFGFSIVRSTPVWYGFAVNYATNILTRIIFQGNCASQISINYSNETEPTDLSFNSPGNYVVELTAASSTTESVIQHNISIQNLPAPVITIGNDNTCIGSQVTFQAIESSGLQLSSWNWDLGNGNSSTAPQPISMYNVASQFEVVLNAMASNGCHNKVVKQLQIFNPPQASFTLPIASPYCTNQNYTYTNTSTYDNGSNPTWQWSVNGTNVSAAKDLNYLFTSSATQSLVLTASIPGCSTQSNQNITSLVDGPLVSFNSPSTGCKGLSVSFTNTTTDPITSYSWSFGDGNTSSQFNSSNTYTSTGIYTATLNATNASGCQNFFSKDISIYSVPQPDFAIEAPPLSCERSPSQFDNLTPSLVDSNISSWTWNFGDTNNGSSTSKSPAYTYSSAGNYNVSLQATSNFGCSKSVQKSITIFPSPQANFTNSAACVNQNTRFTDASSGNVTFYQWTVQNNILSGATPSYTFKSSGLFPVTLTITSANGCTNQVTKSINVPVLPVIDFSVQAPCTGHPTVFQEINIGGADPAVAWNWNFGQGSGTGSPTKYQFPSEDGYTVTMNTTRQSGCVYSISKNISISAGPMARFTPSVFAGAAPLNVSFTNSSTADSYLWSFGDATQSTSTAVSPSFTYLSLGTYKALLTAKNSLGCSDTLSTKIDVVIPHIDIAMNNFSLTTDPVSKTSKPVVTVLNSGNIPLIDPVVIIDLGGGVSIKETISGMVRPGKTLSQTLGLQIIPSSLRYICAELDVTDDANLDNNKQCVSLTNDDVVLAPYPNPSSSGQVTIEWIGASQESAIVKIYRSNGEIVFEQHLDSVQAGLGQLSINTSSFPNGLYLVQFAGSRSTKTFRIVIAN